MVTFCSGETTENERLPWSPGVASLLDGQKLLDWVGFPATALRLWVILCIGGCLSVSTHVVRRLK